MLLPLLIAMMVIRTTIAGCNNDRNMIDDDKTRMIVVVVLITVISAVQCLQSLACFSVERKIESFYFLSVIQPL